MSQDNAAPRIIGQGAIAGAKPRVPHPVRGNLRSLRRIGDQGPIADQSPALANLADALRLGKQALLNREDLMRPETLGLEGYAIWAADELSPSGTFVRDKMRAGAAARGSGH